SGLSSALSVRDSLARSLGPRSSWSSRPASCSLAGRALKGRASRAEAFLAFASLPNPLRGQVGQANGEHLQHLANGQKALADQLVPILFLVVADKVGILRRQLDVFHQPCEGDAL